MAAAGPPGQWGGWGWGGGPLRPSQDHGHFAALGMLAQPVVISIAAFPGPQNGCRAGFGPSAGALQLGSVIRQDGIRPGLSASCLGPGGDGLMGNSGTGDR